MAGVLPVSEALAVSGEQASPCAGLLRAPLQIPHPAGAFRTSRASQQDVSMSLLWRSNLIYGHRSSRHVLPCLASRQQPSTLYDVLAAPAPSAFANVDALAGSRLTSITHLLTSETCQLLRSWHGQQAWIQQAARRSLPTSSTETA